MNSINVDSRTFDFPDEWLVVKYDEIPYYTTKFQNPSKGKLKPEMKAVDLIALGKSGNEQVMYMIESKDYRVHRRTKDMPPAEEFIHKVLDTLTGMIPAALCGDGSPNEIVLRNQLCKATKLRLVFQFEQPAKHSKLFPRAFDPADIQTKIRAELRSIDPHALVIDADSQGKVAWSVR
jgi:hypothetical protein